MKAISVYLVGAVIVYCLSGNSPSQSYRDAVGRRFLISIGLACCGFLLCWWGGQDPNHSRRLFGATLFGGWLLIGCGLLYWWTL